MGSIPPLLTFLLAVVSGWAHRRQLPVIEFLQAENGALKDRLRDKRIRFTDAERALLARKAKMVGRKALMEMETSLLVLSRRLAAMLGSGRKGTACLTIISIRAIRNVHSNKAISFSLMDRVGVIRACAS
jgi:hypothetical protein